MRTFSGAAPCSVHLSFLMSMSEDYAEQMAHVVSSHSARRMMNSIARSFCHLYAPGWLRTVLVGRINTTYRYSQWLYGGFKACEEQQRKKSLRIMYRMHPPWNYGNCSFSCHCLGILKVSIAIENTIALVRRAWSLIMWYQYVVKEKLKALQL